MIRSLQFLNWSRLECFPLGILLPFAPIGIIVESVAFHLFIWWLHSTFLLSIHYNSEVSTSPTPRHTVSAGSDVLTASFDNLVPGRHYLFIVSKTGNMSGMLNVDNLLYIDQKKADASGKITFSYQPRESYDGAVVKNFGSANITVVSIAIKNKPTKLTYTVGETLDTAGINKTINLGSPVTLSLSATGSGLTYKWYFKKSGQTSFSTWNGRTHATETCTPNASWNGMTHASETVSPNATWDGMNVCCIVKDSTGSTMTYNAPQIKIK
jgi:hypothetical protein